MAKLTLIGDVPEKIKTVFEKHKHDSLSKHSVFDNAAEDIKMTVDAVREITKDKIYFSENWCTEVIKAFDYKFTWEIKLENRY